MLKQKSYMQQLLQRRFGIGSMPIPAELLLLLLFLLHLYFAWPGQMGADSVAQYGEAMQGVYSDHHPPLMAFVWRFLARIHEGPGLMLLLNLSLLYGGIFFLIRSVVNKKNQYLLLLVPLIPNVLIYSFYVWKDVSYAFSFLFVSCYLAYITLNKRPLSLPALLLLLPILLYGAAVKFQAQYLAVFTLLWLVLAFNNYKLNYKMLVKFLVISGVFYYSLISINNYLVPNQQKSNSWQFVKMYDIAAISVATHKPLLPDFIKLSGYSEQEMLLRFNHKAVDSLIYGDCGRKPILQKTSDKAQQEKLLAIWKDSLLSHPFYYLQHRLFNAGYLLFDRAGFEVVRDFFQEIGIYKYKVAHMIIGGLAYPLLMHVIPIMLAFIYFGFAFYCLIIRVSRENAISLLFFNVIAVGMFLILFIFSMAGIPRYTYISVCMVHASHLFAYQCFKAMRRKPK